MGTLERGCYLIPSLVGHNGERNNVVFKNSQLESKAAIIFFCGDVMNLEKEMNTHHQYQRFTQWSLEAIVDRFSSQNRHCAVIAIQPSRMEQQTYSCFDNFVKSDSYGSPKHDFSGQVGKAVHHLQSILEQLDQRLSISLSSVRKTIIGFSKGVVVLNQLLLECNTKYFEPFFKSVQTMCWLDGGHNGGKETWITDKKLLTDFARTNKNIQIDIRVTPYQISDKNRPWIGKEEELFSTTLLDLLGPNQVRRQVFFSDERTLISHFQ